MKYCNKCKLDKDEALFDSDATKKDGLTSNCTECRRNYFNHDYYPANKKTIIQKVTSRKRQCPAKPSNSTWGGSRMNAGPSVKADTERKVRVQVMLRSELLTYIERHVGTKRGAVSQYIEQLVIDDEIKKEKTMTVITQPKPQVIRMELDNGRYAEIVDTTWDKYPEIGCQLSYGKAGVEQLVGPDDDAIFDDDEFDRWFYSDVETAKAAFAAWDHTKGGDPEGWIYNPSTARYRPGGDTNKEVVVH